jgi:dipeptide transport system permease protein
VIGIAVVAVSVLVGTILGLTAGYFRGIYEIAVMRAMDIILTLPSLLLAIVIVAILGPGMMNAMLAVAVVILPHYVRITRAAVISETSKDYVTAARMNGASHLRLMFSEVLPNCAAPLIVQASLGISTAILDAAALGFLGLGAQPPSPEWGTMLADAREFVLRAWWVVTFPGIMILVTVLAFNLLGDGCATRSTPNSNAEDAGHGIARNQESLGRLPVRQRRHARGRRRRPDAAIRATCWASLANRARARASR